MLGEENKETTFWLFYNYVAINLDILTKYHRLTNSKQFISHSSGDWEVQGQGTGRFDVWKEPDLWFIDSCPVLTQSGRDKGTLYSLF